MAALMSANRAAAAQPDLVRIHAEGIILPAALFKPEGPGPFPAVVALHGCAGLFLRNGSLDARSADWAERLTGQGFVVLFPDSFGPRGVGPQCRVADRRVRSSRERTADAHAARRWLQAQPFVKRDAVSVLGWSLGATTVLYAVRANKAAERLVGDGPDFRAAVALYPGCRTLAEAGGYASRMPLSILIGAEDDWTPAEPCVRLAHGSQKITLTVYPGAYHDFDHPDQPVTLRRGLAFTAAGNGEARSGTDPAARADAIQRVPSLLAR
jgi:dienelactone hydrolase